MMTVDVFCDKNFPNEPKVVGDEGDVDMDPCHPRVKVMSAHGCSKWSLNAFWKWCDGNKYIIACVLLVIGLFNITLGKKLFRPTLFLVGLFSTVAVIFLIFYALILKDKTKPWVGWVVLGCAVVLGIIAGFMLTKLFRFGVFALGAWAGVIAALLLNNTFMYKLNS